MLSAGTRLGPYEIVAPLGAGGMGVVYRARDSRLHREVAIKVIAESLAQDADAIRRFEQETRAVASLSHPNILVAPRHRPDRHHADGSDRGRPVRGDRAARRRIAARAADPHAAGLASGRRDRAGHRGRPRVRARARHRPSRPQAGERVPDLGRPRQNPRLRPRARDTSAVGQRLQHADRRRHHARRHPRHHRLRGAGADQG